MANVNARTYSIALVLGGIALVIASISGYEFGQRGDTTLLGIFASIGIVIVILSIPVYIWERDRFYKDREQDRQFPK